MRVLIIESPGLSDITTGDRPGERLSEQLRLMRLPAAYSPIHTGGLLDSTIGAQAGSFDVLHLAGHANEKILAFTDNSSFPWLEVAKVLSRRAEGKIVAISACNSFAAHKASETLGKALQAAGYRGAMPACILTFFGNIALCDTLLTWGLFYRHLSRAGVIDARAVFDALTLVKGAGLEAKVCAAWWSGTQFHDVSPWSTTSRP